MGTVVAFFVGMFVGCVFGVVLLALLMGSDND